MVAVSLNNLCNNPFKVHLPPTPLKDTPYITQTPHNNVKRSLDCLGTLTFTCDWPSFYFGLRPLNKDSKLSRGLLLLLHMH
jgi:hypothetical protein